MEFGAKLWAKIPCIPKILNGPTNEKKLFDFILKIQNNFIYASDFVDFGSAAAYHIALMRARGRSTLAPTARP